MSVKRRRLFAALSVGLWAWWVAMNWATNRYGITGAHVFASDCVRVIAFLTSFLTMLGYIVCPVIAAIRLGRDIGHEEARCRCQCHKTIGSVVSINRLRASRDT